MVWFSAVVFSLQSLGSGLNQPFQHSKTSKFKNLQAVVSYITTPALPFA